MATLNINDLPVSQRQDRKAMMALRGGMSFGWIRPYQSSSPSSPFNLIIGTLQVFNFQLNNAIFKTINQTNLIDIDVTETIDSFVQIGVSQENLGSNGGLPVAV